MTSRNPYLSAKVFLILAGLATLPYLRSLGLPLISDDHLQVLLSRQYGPIQAWGALLADPLYRNRTTSLFFTHWTELLAGFSPLVFHLSSLGVHIVNTWLVLMLGTWSRVGWRLGAIAAGFFAVYEGHQEAVIWYAALPELLVFTFVLLSFLCWVRWIESDLQATWWLVASFASFALALASKESGAALPALLLLPLAGRRVDWRRVAPVLAVFAAGSVGYFLTVKAGQAGNQHFHDGTFELGAPVARTVARSMARLFWVWGLLAVASLAAFRPRKYWPAAALGAVWAAIAFLPYSFLTYMPFVPSRHTYLASVGLSIVVAGGFLEFADRQPNRRWAPALAAAVVIAYCSGNIWITKQRQFLERAEATQQIIRVARSSQGPIYVRCFPFPFPSAAAAVVIEGGRPIETVREWSPDAAASDPTATTFCFEGAGSAKSPIRRGQESLN